MSLSDLASIGSLISGVAVLISLVYLALQVRQAERNQRAAVQQARLSRSSDQLMGLADGPVARAWLKGMRGDDSLAGEEFLQFALFMTAMLRSTEDVFFQHDLGLLDAVSLDNQLGPLRMALRTRGGLALWRTVKANYDATFAARVEAIVPAQLTDDYLPAAIWKAELAKLRAV
ncbi:MAG TPA: hypothetical protein VGG48_07120 [Rhizomicrobium sp.]|jgi:hypothetical protein